MVDLMTVLVRAVLPVCDLRAAAEGEEVTGAVREARFCPRPWCAGSIAAAAQPGCETSAMSSTRRPLGHGPVPFDGDQVVRAVRGRTAAERATEEIPQRPALPTEPGFVAVRRNLGAGPVPEELGT